jgi:hypothetical protein
MFCSRRRGELRRGENILWAAAILSVEANITATHGALVAFRKLYGQNSWDFSFFLVTIDNNSCIVIALLLAAEWWDTECKLTKGN